MVHWWQERWLRLHATAAPFGVSIATLLLTFYLEGWQWQGRASWELAGDLVDLGTAFYAMVAVLLERGINFMFWAWEQHKKRQEKLREEGREEARREARKYRAQLERVSNEAREKGITLGSLREPTPVDTAQAELLATMQARARAENRPEIAEWLASAAENNDGVAESRQR